MKKKFFKSMGGVISISAGVYLFYLFLNTLNDGGNFLYFGLSLVLFAAATFAFIQADKTKKVSEEILIDPHLQTEGAPSILERNNQISQQYGKTMKAREELKMLELANTPSKD